MKVLVLVLLCAQNSLYTLLRRYSRGVLKEEVSSSAVLLAAEVLKFLVSSVLVCSSSGVKRDRGLPSKAGALAPLALELPEQLREGFLVICQELRAGLPMLVPAATYLVMNMLSFKAIELVDATVFAMIAQLKILTTAAFSLAILGKRLSTSQWRAIAILTLAVTIITYQRGSTAPGASEAGGLRATGPYLVGVAMVLVEISLSGWISAYFEKHLKNGQSSVWGRNLQLSFWSMLIYGCIQVCQTYTALSDAGVRQGDDLAAAERGVAGLVEDPSLLRSFLRMWSPVTILLVLLGGAGGLLVAFAIKYADAVMKSMASAFSLVIVVVTEILFFHAVPDPVVLLAAGIALLGLQSYQEAPAAEPPKALAAEVASP